MKIVLLIKSVVATTRALNLFIICLVMLLTRHTLIQPVMKFGGLQSSLSDFEYNILVVIVLLIAAGGYVINDIFDVGADQVNKPGKNHIGAVYSRKTALILYSFLTLSGITLSWYFSVQASAGYALWVVIFCACLLYFYSASYKKLFLAGNFVVAFLSGLTIFFSILFDKHALLSEPVMTLVSAYSIFAFGLTLIREIIKDCEDVAGDETYGASTLPIVAGLKTARIIAAVLTLAVIISILWIQVYQQQWENRISFIYVTIFVQAPLVYLVYKLVTASKKFDDKLNSMLSKIIMLTGILTMPVFYLSSI